MEELKKLYEEIRVNEEKFKTLSGGEKILVRLYGEVVNKNRFNERITDLLVVGRDVIWDNEYDSFLYALNRFKINEFIFASTWSSSIEFLAYLIENGYRVDKTIVYEMSEFNSNVTKSKGIKLVKE